MLAGGGICWLLKLAGLRTMFEHVPGLGKCGRDPYFQSGTNGCCAVHLVHSEDKYQAKLHAFCRNSRVRQYVCISAVSLQTASRF